MPRTKVVDTPAFVISFTWGFRNKCGAIINHMIILTHLASERLRKNEEQVDLR